MGPKSCQQKGLSYNSYLFWIHGTGIFLHVPYYHTNYLDVGEYTSPMDPVGTVDGSEILHQLISIVYPVIYKVLYIPGGCLGFSSINSINGQN